MSDTPGSGMFLNLLQKSELLKAGQFDEAVERLGLAEIDKPEAVAQVLVQHKLLTAYQAERLLAGQSRGFFVDRYKILEMLAVGGMGHVFIAEDTETRQRVAMKMLAREHETDRGMLARFQLEARAGMLLKHPNVVRTHRIDRTAGIFGDVYYMVMEFVEAISLEELIAIKGPIPWRQACDFVGQAACGLHHAHKRGLVHRDVKPANLLVTPAGLIKVLDFGLSLFDREGDEFSLAMIFGHDCLGTADYIAPEQSLDSYKVDARADVYSLGCTFYAALTGRVPYPVKSVSEKLALHRTSSPRPVQEIVPDIPDAVVAVLDRMVARDRVDRFPSAASVARALQPLAKRQPANFDFRSVLKLRIREAQKRMTAKESRNSKSSAAANVETRVGSMSTARPRPLPEPTLGDCSKTNADAEPTDDAGRADASKSDGRGTGDSGSKTAN